MGESVSILLINRPSQKFSPTGSVQFEKLKANKIWVQFILAFETHKNQTVYIVIPKKKKNPRVYIYGNVKKKSIVSILK